MFQLPSAKSVVVNPPGEDLRQWTLELMPRVTVTEFDNVNYQARVTARLVGSTFFVADHEIYQNRISREEAERWARLQDEHIAQREMVLIEGYIGPDPDFRTGTRLFMEKSNCNIPAMQRQLFFERDDDYEREFTVIYTPSLKAEGKPDECLIIVDLDNWVTRVLGSDYFGESKMGSLRMWNKLIYDRGGLALHSGLKTFPAERTPDGEEKAALIIGLSGTGKTTTTFREQLGSLPVQDDFVALMPGGEIHASEDGCFAKTFGLDPEDEPTIYGGATRPDAWLENVGMTPDGKADFFDDSYTANGRCTFPLANIRHRSPADLPRASHLFILNRNDNIIPAVAKLERDQIALYFMLGETKGTSAGGAAEAGRNIRKAGTNPFFFDNDALQGNRLLEILDTMPDLEVYVLNTGNVGGGDDDERSKKIAINDSSAIVSGIIEGTIEWETDPDFGYAVAVSVPGVDDLEKLQPRHLYDRQGRIDEYKDTVERLRSQRRAYLESFPDIDERIIAAL